MARGHLRQRTPGSWQILYWQDGKQRAKTIKGTKRDAERRLTEILRSIDSGTYTPPSKMTMGELFSRWLEEASGKVGPTTSQRYESVVRVRLTPALGRIQVAAIRPLELMDLMSEWRREGLSAATIGGYCNVLRQALDMAVRMELIQRNPSLSLKPPPVSRKAKGILDQAEMLKLLDASQGTRYYIPIVLAVTTGMRVGEICGLMWEDVDFERKLLLVKRTAARIKNKVILKDPKTKSSRRVIDLPGIALEVLREARKEGGMVFPREDGDTCCPAAVGMGVKRLCRSLGLNISVHGLRHTHASHLMRENVHIKVVSERMGHANPGITLGTYTHTLPSQQRQAADLVDRALRRDDGDTRDY